MGRKARAAARRGRPPGPADLRRSANRFRRVIADALGFVLGLDPHPAAAGGVAIDIGDFVIIAVRGEPRFAVPRTMYGGREQTLAGAAGTIARKGAGPPLGTPVDQSAWHQKCSAYFWETVLRAAAGDTEGEEANLGQLARLDPEWLDVWRRFICAAINAPVRLDLDARDADPISKPISGILKAICRRRGRDVDKIFCAQKAARRTRKSLNTRKSPAR